MKPSPGIRYDDAGAVAASAVTESVSGNRVRSTSGARIHILHVLDRLDVGGTEKGIAKLIQGLDPDRFQHSICTLRGSAPVARSWMVDADIRDAGGAGAGFQFNVPRLMKIMRTIRPTIVHSRNWGGIEGTLAARCAGVPVVVHSEHGYEISMANGLPMRQRVMRHAAYRCANAIFTVSKELRNYHAVQAWWDVKSIGVLHNGVDGEKFCPSQAVSSRVRQQLGIRPDALVVGYVGRLIALKDVRTLLLAAENLVPDFSELHVMVVGSGPDLTNLQNLVANIPTLKDRVCFTGAREDVADLLKAMDIFVLPSRLEGMSNTVLEAMATGLPVVTTSVGGSPEIVADSICGYLFQPGDVAGLTARLSALLRSREAREDFGQAARERTHERFSLEAMLERYRRLYCELTLKPGSLAQTGHYVWN